MKKKAIEKIPYLGLKQVSRGQDVKYIGVTAVKTWKCIETKKNQWIFRSCGSH